MMDISVDNRHFALLMTLVSSLSTGIGGLIVYTVGDLSPRILGVSLAFSAGVMLYISFLDIILESSLGAFHLNAAFFGGIVGFAVLHALVPDVDLGPDMTDGAGGPGVGGAGRTGGKARGGTGEARSRSSSTRSGSRARKRGGRAEVEVVTVTSSKHAFRSRSLTTGIVTALALSLHNFPEGIAVYLNCLRGMKTGILFGLAIAVHNIPEGMCIAMPIAIGTGSKAKGVMYSVLSGMAEPLGALIFGYLFVDHLSAALTDISLVAVAGMMTAVVFTELLPAAYSSLSPKEVGACVTLGMAVIAASIHFVEFVGNKHVQ